MQVLLGRHWHHLPLDQAVELLETDLERGLDLFEIKHRQERFGPNVLTPRRGKSPLVRFLLQFNNPLVYILLAASVITARVKDLVDSVIILGVCSDWPRCLASDRRCGVHRLPGCRTGKVAAPQAGRGLNYEALNKQISDWRELKWHVRKELDRHGT